MSKEVLAVDVDEVLFPFVAEFSLHHNQFHGTKLKPEDFFCYEFEKVIGSITRPEAVERVYAFVASDHSAIPPIDQAEAALARLGEKFDLKVITARHPDFADNTKSWLDQFFKEHFSSVVSIGYATVMEKPRTKAEVCHEIGAISLIDDSVGHVTECARAGIPAVLFGDYPWNQANELPQGVTRCTDWSAVLEHFGAA